MPAQDAPDLLRADLRKARRRRSMRHGRRAFGLLAALSIGAAGLGSVSLLTALRDGAAAATPVSLVAPVHSLSVTSGVTLPTPGTGLTPVATEPASDAVLASFGVADEIYGIDLPSSITVVVNKQRSLTPVDWEPSDLVYPEGVDNPNDQPLRAEASAALEAMHAAASDAGIRFHMVSGYRSYDLQTEIFSGRVNAYGEEAAEQRSAHPGHSEHQTGLAVDLDDATGCELRVCFGETATGQWLRENAHRFGFILRYDAGTQATVGFQYEPWHFRYVGPAVSADMHESGIRTLEGYFGLPDAPKY